MKRCLLYLSLALAATISNPIAAWTQVQPPQDKPAAPQSADENDKTGLTNYFLRTFKLSGSIRERWEATDGPFSVTSADSYVLSQIRLGLAYNPSPWLHFFAEAQDVRPLFYRAPLTNNISDPFDLHSAWMSLGRSEGPGVFVKIGREPVLLGSGHLIAATDAWWTLTARNFDVVDGTYTNRFFKSELVAGSAVLVDPFNINEHKPGDHVYADYNTFSHLLPGASVEPYLIVRTTDNVTSKEGQLGNMDTLALGLRVVGKIPGGFDYNVEPLHEFGAYSSDRLSAAGLLAGAGWTTTSSAWKPRISTDYFYASGDNGVKNGTRETFDNMYGFNCPMNSLTGQFAWKNIKDLRAGVEFAPFKKLKFKVDGREFWLADVHDGLYNSLGAVTVKNTKATSAHVGESVEMMATATVTRTTAIGFGVGTLFPGEYLKQAKKDQAYIYPYISFLKTF